jgi:hypothetical protein
MDVNGTYIDAVELMEYWRMSNAWKVGRHKRMLWASDRYAKANDMPSIRAYKALDRMIPSSPRLW